MAKTHGEIELLFASVARGDSRDLESCLSNNLCRQELLRARDMQGRSVLMIATEAGGIEIVRRLIECGADVNAIDNRGRSILFAAVRRKLTSVRARRYQAAYDLLKEAGAVETASVESMKSAAGLGFVVVIGYMALTGFIFLRSNQPNDYGGPFLWLLSLIAFIPVSPFLLWFIIKWTESSALKAENAARRESATVTHSIDEIQCPYCAERIPSDATTCEYCRELLPKS